SVRSSIKTRQIAWGGPPRRMWVVGQISTPSARELPTSLSSEHVLHGQRASPPHHRRSLPLPTATPLRQLKYEDTDKALVLAIANAWIAALVGGVDRQQAAPL